MGSRWIFKGTPTIGKSEFQGFAPKIRRVSNPKP